MRRIWAVILIGGLLFLQLPAAAYAQTTLDVPQEQAASLTASPGQPEGAAAPEPGDGLPPDEPAESAQPQASPPLDGPAESAQPQTTEPPPEQAEPSPDSQPPATPVPEESASAAPEDGPSEPDPCEPSFVISIPQTIDLGPLTPEDGVIDRAFTISARDLSGLDGGRVEVTVRSSHDFHLVPRLEGDAALAGTGVPYRLLGQTDAVEQGGVVAAFVSEAAVECRLVLDCSGLADGTDYTDTLIFDVRLAAAAPAGGAAEGVEYAQ